MVSSEKMRVGDDGNVGIGTTAPGEKLEVAGNVKASGNVTAASFSGGGALSGTQLISTVASGTAPLSVTSNTLVPSLNADLLDGLHAANFATLGANVFVGNQAVTGDVSATGSVSGGSGSFTGSTSSWDSSIVTVTQQGSTTTPPGPFPTRPPFALLGEASATTGWAVGVGGVAYSPDAYGVEGANLATTAGGVGVRGITLGTSGIGVVGGADADSGSTIGVYGRVNSSSGTAGIFNNLAGGNILRGDSNYVNKFLVDGSGNVRANSYLDLSGNPIGGGTVTSVGSGTGLTGGPITTSGTLSLDTTFTDGRYAAQAGLDAEALLRANADTVLQTDVSSRVSKGGDIMLGTLNLPTNGLVAGTNQLVLSAGNVGVGTASPAEKLEVAGTVKATGFSGDGSGLTNIQGSQIVNTVNTLQVALLRWYPANQAGAAFAVGSYPIGVAFDGANIWVANLSDHNVTKLRASDGANLGSFAVSTYPDAVAFDGANIWVANYSSNNVTKLRASDGANLGTFAVGSQPYGVAFDGANIWVANGASNTVSKL